MIDTHKIESVTLSPTANRIPTFVTATLIGIGVYTLLPFLLLSLYSHPTADDFSFAERDNSLSFFAAQAYYYLNWSGRYFGTAIVRLNPIVYDSLGIYKLYSFIILLLFSGAAFFTIRTITLKVLEAKGVLTLSALLLTLYLLQLPSPAEGFYFFSTYATYQLPNIMLLVMLSFIYKFFYTENLIAKKLYIGIAAILCAAIVGSNEMALVITFTTIAFITTVNLKNKVTRPYLLFLFIICITCCFVAVLAPGNFSRMSDHPNGGKFIWSAVYAAFMTGLSFYRWLLPLLAASIIYILYFGLPLAYKLKSNRAFAIDLRLALLYFLGTLFLMNFVFAWSTGERATPRLENVIYFFFLLGWFYSLQVAIHNYKNVFRSNYTSFIIPALALLMVILHVLHIESNTSTAYIDLLSGNAAAYDKALNQRYASLKASDCSTCIVAPLPAIPKTIFFADVVARSEFDKKREGVIDRSWVNKGFAAYWGKAEVYLSTPNPAIQSNLETIRTAGKSKLRNESVIE
jgi:hypothetical protein